MGLFSKIFKTIAKPFTKVASKAMGLLFGDSVKPFQQQLPYNPPEAPKVEYIDPMKDDSQQQEIQKRSALVNQEMQDRKRQRQGKQQSVFAGRNGLGSSQKISIASKSLLGE